MTVNSLTGAHDKRPNGQRQPPRGCRPNARGQDSVELKTRSLQMGSPSATWKSIVVYQVDRVRLFIP